MEVVWETVKHHKDQAAEVIPHIGDVVGYVGISGGVHAIVHEGDKLVAIQLQKLRVVS